MRAAASGVGVDRPRAVGVVRGTIGRARRRSAVVVVMAAVLGLPLVVPATATAATGNAVHGATSLDLARDWGTAGACLVHAGETIVRCFDDEAAMDAHVATLPMAATACSSWTKLYEDRWFGGRVLQFRDRGHWQDLAPYGFSDRTSSWRVGGCPATLAKGSGGSGSWLHQAPHVGANAPSSWDDTISSLMLG